MPIWTLDALVKRDQTIVQHYARAAEIWNELLAQVDAAQAPALLKQALMDIFVANQWRFEHECGGRLIGQEVMVWSFFARLYEDGFGDNLPLAWAANQAFEECRCSIEIHHIAAEAASIYLIHEDEP